MASSLVGHAHSTALYALLAPRPVGVVVDSVLLDLLCGWLGCWHANVAEVRGLLLGIDVHHLVHTGHLVLQRM